MDCLVDSGVDSVRILPLAANVRGRTIYLTQIGYIPMKTQEALEVRMQRIPAYVEIFTGQAPQARELQRFQARHGYTREGTQAASGTAGH